MSRTVYVASRPIRTFPLPRTRLVGTFCCAAILQFGPAVPPVRIITSRQRRRTVAARLRSGVLELVVPATMPIAERQHWAEVMSKRLERRAGRRRAAEQRLQERADRFNNRRFYGRRTSTSVGFAGLDAQ